MTATVSVALCTYNGERYIEEQLDSIADQSQPPTEIIVSDDASTDGTLDRVRGFAQRCPVPVRILENSRALGVVGNFERAVSAATGDLVALSDQDDRWMHDRLARATREFRTRPNLVLLGSNARLVDSEGRYLGHSLFEALELSGAERASLRSSPFEALMHRNLVTGATVLFRRSLLEIALPFAQSWVHDEWLAVLAGAAGEVELLDEPLIDYRQHGSNQIGASRLSLLGKLVRLAEPRSDRNSRLQRRAHDLVDRLAALGDAVPADLLQVAHGKLNHETVRNALPARRVQRIGAVLGEARRGGYRRYGRGSIDIVRDLVQSAR